MCSKNAWSNRANTSATSVHLCIIFRDMSQSCSPPVLGLILEVDLCVMEGTVVDAHLNKQLHYRPPISLELLLYLVLQTLRTWHQYCSPSIAIWL